MTKEELGSAVILMLMGMILTGTIYFLFWSVTIFFELISEPALTNEQIILNAEICTKAGMDYEIYTSSNGYAINVTCTKIK